MTSLVSEIDSLLELRSDQLSLLRKFKQWVEEEADFYGRTDEDFLVLFLRSCDFDLEQSKTTLRLYYQVRVKYPEWWANRDPKVPQIQSLIDNRACFMFLEQHPNQPTVGIVHLSGFGADPSIVSPGGKLLSCGLDFASRRRSCQLHGGVLIIDFANLYWWMVWKALWPPFAIRAVSAYAFCLPLKIKSVVLVNGPSIVSTIVNVLNTFLTEENKNKLCFCKSWSDLGQYVPLELVPIEYGGRAGPAKRHEDASRAEFSALFDYFEEDNKYGFRTYFKLVGLS